MNLDIILDPIGFPLIRAGGLYVHFLPVTKIQIEYFLCSTNETAYDEAWYTEVLGFNPRISPASITPANLIGVFVTGVLPRDARSFAQWCGTTYDLPTAAQWTTIFTTLNDVIIDARIAQDHIEQILSKDKLNARARTIITNIHHSISSKISAGRTRSLSDQMLMRGGVMEYVYLNDQHNTYGGFGETKFSLFDPSKGHPETLNNSREGARLRHYGFRLVKQG